MKNVISIFLFSLLLTLVISGCKKENITIQNNPNIAHFEINRTLNITTHKLDTFNLDNIDAYDVSFYLTTIGGQLAATVYTTDATSGIVEDTLIGLTTYAKPIDKNNAINSFSRFAQGEFGVVLYNGAISFERGIKGDKYLGFKVKLADGVHYGWILVSMDTGKYELGIKEIAYNKLLNAAIKAGER